MFLGITHYIVIKMYPDLSPIPYLDYDKHAALLNFLLFTMYIELDLQAYTY